MTIKTRINHQNAEGRGQDVMREDSARDEKWREEKENNGGEMNEALMFKCGGDGRGVSTGTADKQNLDKTRTNHVPISFLSPFPLLRLAE